MANYDQVNDLVNRLHERLADDSNQFYDTDEEIAALNDGLYQIFQVVHSHHLNYFFDTTPEQITLSSGTNFYALTNDFAAVAHVVPNARPKIPCFSKSTSPKLRVSSASSGENRRILRTSG